MQTRRWLNPSLAQTLQIAVLLLYITGAFSVLFGVDDATTYFLRRAHINDFRGLLGLAIAGAHIAAGYGIANERKWAYYLGVVLTALPLLGVTIYCITQRRSPFELDLVELIFQVGVFVLLIHPQSRDYQRVWFK